MSYYTQLHLSWDDSDYVSGSLTVENVISVAREYVLEQKWSDDVLTDLRRACGSSTMDSPGFNKMLSFGVIELLQNISHRIPNVTFYAKGSGEEFWDIWIREFRDGKTIVERGPFDELDSPIPQDLLAAAKAAVKAAEERKPDSPSWLSKLFRR